MAQPVAKSFAVIELVSARHEILLAGAPDPPPPPPQHIHAVPLYATELIRIPGSTDPPEVAIARHPVAPVRSLVKYIADVVPCDPPTTQNRLLDAIQTGWNVAEPVLLMIPEIAVHPTAPYLSVV